MCMRTRMVIGAGEPHASQACDLQVLATDWARLEGSKEGSDEWGFDGVIRPEHYATNATRWLESGVQLIGGCCGTRPDHIAPLPGICAACEARMGRWNITRL